MVELARWRDAAVILLALEALLLGLLLAAAFYLSLRGLLRLRGRIQPFLFQTRLYIWRASEVTKRLMSAVAAPFICLQSTVEGLRRALDILDRR